MVEAVCFYVSTGLMEAFSHLLNAWFQIETGVIEGVS
jgi:hypothetical protein